MTWDEAPDLWEHQGHGGLTVGELSRAIHGLPLDLPVRVFLYTGEGEGPTLIAAEIGLTGPGPKPNALVITLIKESA